MFLGELYFKLRFVSFSLSVGQLEGRKKGRKEERKEERKKRRKKWLKGGRMKEGMKGGKDGGGRKEVRSLFVCSSVYNCKIYLPNVGLLI